MGEPRASSVDSSSEALTAGVGPWAPDQGHHPDPLDPAAPGERWAVLYARSPARKAGRPRLRLPRRPALPAGP